VGGKGGEVVGGLGWPVYFPEYDKQVWAYGGLGQWKKNHQGAALKAALVVVARMHEPGADAWPSSLTRHIPTYTQLNSTKQASSQAK
jgi:hypothetical protein